jgi:hypothetical protein
LRVYNCWSRNATLRVQHSNSIFVAYCGPDTPDDAFLHYGYTFRCRNHLTSEKRARSSANGRELLAEAAMWRQDAAGGRGIER